KEILQEALKNSEQANNAKSMFLSSMSHDIRTPMNAIVGMTQLVINDMDNKEQVRESIGIIDTASKHLLSIINDVLDMSKIENGSLIFAHEQLNLDEEVDSIKEIMLPVLNEKQQTITLDINDVTHKCCVGDAIRLRRVMINILNNASKFTQAGGEINVEIKELHNNNPKIALYRFTVSDNGQGIEKHALEHIFEPFYRENSINTKEIEGTGLGLAIVKGIIEAQGGSIDIKSELGKGTTVTMQISFHIAEQECEIKKATSQNPLLQKVRENFDGLKVLLVEDHPVNTIVAKRLFENCGATVTDVANGSIAYDVFSQSEKDRFDIIFMDIQMPVMNGYEATIAIRNCQHPRAKTIPIIAMTANAFAEDIKKSLDVGMNGHVAKPIDVKNIANAINAAREDK
ncbi:MAG: ATP-binding protein, partial [Oscillospiraceae bacterium]